MNLFSQPLQSTIQTNEMKTLTPFSLTNNDTELGCCEGKRVSGEQIREGKEPRCSLSDHCIRMWQKFSGMEFAKTTCKTYWVQVPKTEIRSHNQGPYKKCIGLTSLLKMKIPQERNYLLVRSIRIKYSCASLTPPFLRIYSTLLFLRIPANLHFYVSTRQ